ncbi:MAG: T9SS type A sorting domain-containing protein [Candidatus Eisenbacteria bacterium]|nr:T9SS type A sorting domain-containing protein [Candidatus Eisenbacteria bacterium]
MTKDGLTIDLKRYEVSPQTGFGGTEGGYSDRDPFGDREPEPRSVKGHVIKLNLVRNDSFRPRGDAWLGGDIEDARLGGDFQDAQVGEEFRAPGDGRLGGESAVEAHSCVPLLEGKDKLASYSNYFLGQDKSKWRSRVGHYRKVVAKEVWPGIDVEYRAEPQGVEMVFRVQPGADVDQIQVEYEGLDAPLSVDNKGNLVLKTSLGNLIEEAPFAYQTENRRQREVAVHYELTTNGYRFVAESYDRNHELVIDPLIYSTYCGGSEVGDTFNSIVIDDENNKVFGGETYAEDFPITEGAYQDSLNSQADGVIAKFSPNGRNLLFSTYIGGPDYDYIKTAVLASESTIWFSGRSGDGTCSPGWPLVNAVDSICGGEVEGIFGLLSTDGTDLEFSSYWGGEGADRIYNCGIDEFGNIYLVGSTSSPDFVSTPGALFEEFPGGASAFITRISPEPITIAYSSFFPGSSSSAFYGLQVVSANNIWISGKARGEIVITEDAYQQAPIIDSFNQFFVQLDLVNNQVLYSTYFCGPDYDWFHVKTLDSNHLLIYGYTQSPTWPVSENAFDPIPPVNSRQKGYIAILQLPDSISHATYLGGITLDEIDHLNVDSDGSFILAGRTGSIDFPVTPDAYDSTLNTTVEEFVGDMFFCRMSSDLSTLLYSTYLGGWFIDWCEGAALEAPSKLWICGVAGETDWPITEDAYQPEVAEGSWGGDAYFLCFELPGYNSIVQRTPFMPDKFSLSIYPNPFNPSTTISFTLPRQAQTSLEVFNVLGQAIYTVDLGQLPAGEYHHLLDAASLSSGTYLTRLNAGEMQEVKKMAVVR